MLVVLTVALLLLTSHEAIADPADAVPLTLKDAIALSQRASPAHLGAAALATGASTAAAAAGRPLNPLLDLRTENWTPSAADALPLDIWATVSQPLELGGKRGLRRAVAAAERDGAVADLAAVDSRLALDTARLYLQALRARGLVDTLASNRDGLAIVLRTLHARVGEGYVAEADLLRVETEAARLDIDITRAGLELSRSLDALTVTLGATTRIEAFQLIIPDAVAAPSFDAVAIAGAVSRHPELVAASARLARAEQAQALERARRLPDPAFTTGVKRTLGLTTVVAAVTTTIPLFDRNAVAIAVSAGSVRAATAERDATRLRLELLAVGLTRTARTLAEQSAGARERMLAPADAVREAAQSAFREGSVDVLRLIDAERVHGEVRRAALDLQLEAIGSVIEARVALGEEPLP